MIEAANSKVSDECIDAIEKSACPTCGSCSGMFTANSMNCLTEALGLSLPGNGSTLATHADRKKLFLKAGRQIVELCKRYYEQDDASVLPRSIGTFDAFENAMSLDIAMGGSSNTVLHLLAAAQEAGVDFKMADIDRLSRVVPCLSKIAPNTNKYHMEDVHRAGGIMGLLGELDRAGLIHKNTHTVLGMTMGEQLDQYDIIRNQDEALLKFFRAGPAGIRTTQAFSQDYRWDTVDDDRINGCIRDKAHAISQEGGLAVLFGNLAEDGCIVKTAGVDESIGLVRDGDIINIDIPNCAINLDISDEELAARRTEQDQKGWAPAHREREVSFALKVFGHFATSADKGAVRDRSLLK